MLRVNPEENFVAAPASWIVVATQTHRESLACDNLLRQGYEVYCPKVLKHIRHARKALDVQRPLFPGYLFVAWKEPFIVRSIDGTYGVRSIVRNGATPALLQGSFVASLRAREVDGLIGQPEPSLKPGQAVTIDGGPFDGLVGRILEVRESDRVLLLLDLLIAPAKLNIDVDMLRPV
jgi:transcriptional antiterminator RfaH